MRIVVSFRLLVSAAIVVAAITQATLRNAHGGGQGAGLEQNPDAQLLHIQAKAVLRGHTAGIWSVAISPDGSVLASGGGQLSAGKPGAKAGEIMLWDLIREKRLAKLASTGGRVHCVAFSRDGSQLVTGQEWIMTQRGNTSGTVTLWDMKTRRATGVYEEFQHPLFAAFSGDGKTLVLGGQISPQSRWAIRCLDIGTGQVRLEVIDANLPALSADGSRIAFGRKVILHSETGCRICDSTTGQDLVNLKVSAPMAGRWCPARLIRRCDSGRFLLCSKSAMAVDQCFSIQ